MTRSLMFNGVRSYYFRRAIARLDREEREYGKTGRGLEAFTLEDFRSIHADATSKAIDWQRASNAKA
jgi:hypothetical protein